MKPTSKKKQPVKARKMWSVTSKEHRDLQPSKKDAEFHQQMHSDLTGDPALVEPVFVIPATQEAALQVHRQIKVAIDQEDGTGNGFDHCAWAVMRSIGITDLTWKQFWRLLEAEHRRITPPTK